MKRQIRQRVFETNSSSTHSICITKNPVTLLPIPECLNFEFDSYGWEENKLTSIKEKTRYLYTCIGYLGSEQKIKKVLQFIVKTLKKHGVKQIYFDHFELCFYCDSKDKITGYIYPGNDGYVDRGDEAIEFVEDVCSDENKLINFLFSDQSFVLTGNDNSGTDVTIRVDYDHDEYYKGN